LVCRYKCSGRPAGRHERRRYGRLHNHRLRLLRLHLLGLRLLCPHLLRLRTGDSRHCQRDSRRQQR